MSQFTKEERSFIAKSLRLCRGVVGLPVDRASVYLESAYSAENSIKERLIIEYGLWFESEFRSDSSEEKLQDLLEELAINDDPTVLGWHDDGLFEVQEQVCPGCSGSGEGRYEGSSCLSCGGSGSCGGLPSKRRRSQLLEDDRSYNDWD